MTLTENTNLNSLGNSTGAIDPVAAGLLPFYDDGIANDRLPQSGSLDPVAGATFVVIDDSVVIPESDWSTETDDPILGDSSETKIDSTLSDPIGGTPSSESLETENPDPLINPGNEAIEDAKSLSGDEIDDTSVTETEDLSEATAEETDSTPEENSDDPETTAENAEVESDDNSDDAEAVTESTAEETQPEEEDDAEEESLAEDAEVAVEPDTTETPTIEDFDFTQVKSGIFTANSDGLVQIDYLFDDGKFESEVAIFSLEGMDELWSADDPKQFIAEASRRSISNSELGGIAINDATQGARFSDAKNRFNSGEYTGVKTL
ncbi:MAG: hypothetical protein WBD58_01820, partial [Geitlerinemataceae cyanobacterium]